jgi:hypothetical protein
MHPQQSVVGEESGESPGESGPGRFSARCRVPDKRPCQTMGELVSAFATVGLSLDLTPKLGDGAKT